jgi:hypothetical protein
MIDFNLFLKIKIYIFIMTIEIDNEIIDHNLFLSSDESDDNDTKKATNGINIINIKSNKNKSNKIKNIINNNPQNPDSNNGWNDDANNTINNWYELFKQQSFIYQWVLDRNKKISNKLLIASIISSSVLGVFSSFKLWMKDETFNTASDLLLMLSNFSIALITSCSKSFIDDKRNEVIQIYIEEVDELLGEISAQVLNSPNYRVNAGDFFKDHNYKYTKLITYVPNISIYELNESKKVYDEFKKHLLPNI